MIIFSHGNEPANTCDGKHTTWFIPQSVILKKIGGVIVQL